MPGPGAGMGSGSGVGVGMGEGSGMGGTGDGSGAGGIGFGTGGIGDGSGVVTDISCLPRWVCVGHTHSYPPHSDSFPRHRHHRSPVADDGRARPAAGLRAAGRR
jgi:hypothetical protein